MSDMPHSPNAESALIGSIIVDSGELDEITIQPDDFYALKNQVVWAAILALREAGSAIDHVTLCRKLDDAGELARIGGPASITGYVGDMPYSTHVRDYARIVAEKATRRRLLNAAREIAVLSCDENIDLDEAQARCESTVLGIRSYNKRHPTGAELAQATFAGIANPSSDMPDRIFAGLSPIDAGTFGIEAGRYWLAAAVSGTGKSVIGINVMRQLSGLVGVLYLTPEQPPAEVVNIALASGTDCVLPLRVKLLQIKKQYREQYAQALLKSDPRLRNAIFGAGFRFEDLVADVTDRELYQLRQARAQLNAKPVWIEEPGGRDIHALRRLFRQKRAQLNREVGVDAFLFVVIDGLGLIHKHTEKVLDALMSISQNVKAASQTDVAPGAILVNHHLNRSIFGGNGGGRRQYGMNHLRDAPVENDADVIVFYDRDSVWERGDKIPPKEEQVNLIFVKNRQTSKVFVGSCLLNTGTLQVRDST